MTRANWTSATAWLDRPPPFHPWKLFFKAYPTKSLSLPLYPTIFSLYPSGLSHSLSFCEDDDFPLQPRSALLPLVLQRRQGQPLSLALVAMELARRLDIPLVGVNFPGRFLLRVPQADHLLDPATGRRLYTPDCRELLLRLQGPKSELQAAYLKQASPGEILQRLSRNLRQLHSAAGEPLAALKDAQRVIELGPVGAADHEARAGLYRQLDCPQAERYDLERALLLSDDPTEQLRLGQRLGELAPPTGRALH